MYIINISFDDYDNYPSPGGYGRPQGGYGRPQGGYGRPQGGYGRPAGGYGRPEEFVPQSGGYGRPQGGYGRPAGGYQGSYQPSGNYPASGSFDGAAGPVVGSGAIGGAAGPVGSGAIGGAAWEGNPSAPNPTTFGNRFGSSVAAQIPVQPSSGVAEGVATESTGSFDVASSGTGAVSENSGSSTSETESVSGPSGTFSESSVSSGTSETTGQGPSGSSGLFGGAQAGREGKPVYSNLGVHTPGTRIKGQIACFSCFARNSGRVNVNSVVPEPQTLQNLSDIIGIIEEAGLNLPVLVNRCGDTMTSNNPNFYGAEIYTCPNTLEEPGACVKLKGFHGGESFVYRECWSRMWKDKRKFKHGFSGSCYSDEFVQTLFRSEKNTLCFCEDDLCNSSPSRSYLTLTFITLLLKLYIE
ncbi:hypothetical protein FO519_007394 [Halicephalobus sp. NKZ332]|nr:hypothetical protein FO519_007394 [Halicephalobus sp. NKZ332]